MSQTSGHEGARLPRFLFLLAGLLVWTSADGQRQPPRVRARTRSPRAARLSVPRPARKLATPLPELCLDPRTGLDHTCPIIRLK